MHLLIAFLAYGTVLVRSLPSSYHDCAPAFEPQNYLKQLPSLNLPYVNSVPIPINAPLIKATPVVTTKIINVVTKYVTVNPVCIKVTSKKPLCKPRKNNHNLDFLITKEYFVGDRSNDNMSNRENKMMAVNNTNGKTDSSSDRADVELEASETPTTFDTNTRTPKLLDSNIREMLIEDRLDHLEEILPHYTRRRAYETSTVTITKTTVDNRVKATLLVKNCVPEGYEFCPPKKRKSRVSEDINNLSTNIMFNNNGFT
ncbi:hypothetical protein Trydic_g16852 [Trypoxylus dichotomus]